MTTETMKSFFTKEKLGKLFPPERANEFFEALFGDASEGAYDIELAFKEHTADTLVMDLLLHERPNCCLACNLTQGLPQVFSRHPVINVEGIVKDIDALLGDTAECVSWTLGYTQQYTQSIHAIPITITLKT